MLILVISAILVFGFLQYKVIKRRKGEELFRPNMSWFWIKWGILTVVTFTFISVTAARYAEAFQPVIVDEQVAPVDEYEACYNAMINVGLYCEKKVTYTNNDEYMHVQFYEQQSKSQGILFNSFKESSRVKITLYISY